MRILFNTVLPCCLLIQKTPCANVVLCLLSKNSLEPFVIDAKKVNSISTVQLFPFFDSKKALVIWHDARQKDFAHLKLITQMGQGNDGNGGIEYNEDNDDGLWARESESVDAVWPDKAKFGISW